MLNTAAPTKPVTDSTLSSTVHVEVGTEPRCGSGTDTVGDAP